MSKLPKGLQDLKRAIDNKESLAVLAGRNIWMYEYLKHHGWVRFQIELPTPEAAERRLDSMDDYFCVWPKAGRETGVIAWLTKTLHHEINPVKVGFILCGASRESAKEEPAIAVCCHVLFGAPVKKYRVPVPHQGIFGEAFCADCADGKKRDMKNASVICYHCYLRNQTSVRVTETYVVVANDGENADITREVDGAEFHVNRARKFADMSADEFRAKYPVDGIIEIDRMVERPAAPKTLAEAA